MIVTLKSTFILILLFFDGINFQLDNAAKNRLLSDNTPFSHSELVSNYPVKGITVVAPPKPISQSAFKRLKDIHTEWVAFVPFGFAKTGSPDIRYNLDRQWWGEKMDGLESCIKDASAVGLKIMLKPQIYMRGSWVGHMDFTSETEWLQWEKQYHSFIMEYVCLASRYKVEMFCIGTEFNIAVVKREKFWRKLIEDIRKEYNGSLVYSANWDNYESVKIWEDLDYIGLSSYFPLSDSKTPQAETLKKLWKPIVKKLKNFSIQNKKKILFTEYGYMSVDQCAYKAWEIEKLKHNLAINQRAQANAYDALWESFVSENFWAGGFLWKWFPDGMGHEGYPEKDYTPQDKEAEIIIKKWFSKTQRI